MLAATESYVIQACAPDLACTTTRLSARLMFAPHAQCTCHGMQELSPSSAAAIRETVHLKATLQLLFGLCSSRKILRGMARSMSRADWAVRQGARKV
jgi:hypothetical protein